MEEKNRKGETGPIPPRADRFFREGCEWYFTTREGQTHGPFDTRSEAEDSLAMFLSAVSTSDK